MGQREHYRAGCAASPLREIRCGCASLRRASHDRIADLSCSGKHADGAIESGPKIAPWRSQSTCRRGNGIILPADFNPAHGSGEVARMKWLLSIVLLLGVALPSRGETEQPSGAELAAA